jgi:hypothetical protein
MLPVVFVGRFRSCRAIFRLESAVGVVCRGDEIEPGVGMLPLHQGFKQD